MPGNDTEPSPPPASPAAVEQEDVELNEPDTQEPPPQPFEPLFTLLTNNTTNTTVHPRIHYLFSDDDPSVLAFPPNKDPANRTLVVDLEAAPPSSPGRWAVSWASSLSPAFAVTGSSISLQQNESDGSNGGGGLMLRVEGIERELVETRGESLPSSGSGALDREDMDALADDFRRRMGLLKRVVGEGEKRREVLARDEMGEEAVVDDVEAEPKPEPEPEPEKKEEKEEKGKEPEKTEE